MKISRAGLMGRMGLMIALVMLLALFLVPRQAKADSFKFFYVSAPTNLLAINATTNTSIGGTNEFLTCPPTDLQIEASFTSTNLTGTSNLYLGFNTSGVASNSFTTTLPIVATYKFNGNSTVIDRFTVNRTNLVGVRQIRWDSTGSPQPGNATVNWVRFSWSDSNP